VRLILGPLVDPAAEQLDLMLGQFRLVRVGRRHQLVFVVRGDPLDQRAVLRLAGDDGILNGRVAQVQTQLGLPVALIRTVAGVTPIRQQRPNLPIEINRPRKR